MIVTIDNNITTYEYGKNCIVKIRRLYKDGDYTYLFEYGKRNSVLPQFSVWSCNLPAYYSKLISLAYNYIGFDRNIEQRDIRGLVFGLQKYLKRKQNEKNK